MIPFEKGNLWKYGLFILAIFIILGSFLYTNMLIKSLTIEEKKKMEHWSMASQIVSNAHPNDDLKFPSFIIEDNNTIPAIITDEAGTILFSTNIDTNKKDLKNVLFEMKKDNVPIKIELSNSEPLESYDSLGNPILDTMSTDTAKVYQYLYYSQSTILKKLRSYPFIQLALIFVFFLFFWMAFVSAKNAEQNRVWVGLSKETAHQLGTPLSSLTAWVELLKERMTAPEDQELIQDLEADVNRLEMVAERFSKIGSMPQLTMQPISKSFDKVASYMRRRCSKTMSIHFQDSDELRQISIPYNAPLLEWVLENLIKNALDAMDKGTGTIKIELHETDTLVIADITDTGHGIPSHKISKVFNPGFTTKKRGWGLGLSLAKRIVENYHQGKIYVKESIIGKGTTFRIELLKNPKLK